MDVTMKLKYNQNFLPGIIGSISNELMKNNIIKILLDTDIDLSLFDDLNYEDGFETVCQYASEETIQYCFEKHNYYNEEILKKCIRVTTHKKIILDLLENLYTIKISCLNTY